MAVASTMAPPWSPRPTTAIGCAVTFRSPVTLEGLRRPSRTVRAGDAGERAGAEERRQVTGRLGGPERVHRGRGQVVADHLEDGLGLLRSHLDRRRRRCRRRRHRAAATRWCWGRRWWTQGRALPWSSPPPPPQPARATMTHDHEHPAGDAENEAPIRLGSATRGCPRPIGARSCLVHGGRQDRGPVPKIVGARQRRETGADGERGGREDEERDGLQEDGRASDQTGRRARPPGAQQLLRRAPVRGDGPPHAPTVGAGRRRGARGAHRAARGAPAARGHVERRPRPAWWRSSSAGARSPGCRRAGASR